MFQAGKNHSLTQDLHFSQGYNFILSFILTLVVPYDHIDVGSALIQMWTYVGAP